MRFVVTDVVHSQLKFEERMDLLKAALDSNTRHDRCEEAPLVVEVASMWRCRGRDDLQREMTNRDVMMMLRKPKSFYYERMSFLYDYYDYDDRHSCSAAAAAAAAARSRCCDV